MKKILYRLVSLFRTLFAPADFSVFLPKEQFQKQNELRAWIANNPNGAYTLTHIVTHGMGRDIKGMSSTQITRISIFLRELGCTSTVQQMSTRRIRVWTTPAAIVTATGGRIVGPIEVIGPFSRAPFITNQIDAYRPPYSKNRNEP